MLIKLMPEQAGTHWEDIRVAVEESLPPIVGGQSDRMSNILRSILTGDIIVWISAEIRDGVNLITGIVLTTFTFDGPSGTKALLIYCVYGYGNSSRESWESGWETLKKFAQGEMCNRIVAYSDVESVIKMAERLGAKTNYRLISLTL